MNAMNESQIQYTRILKKDIGEESWGMMIVIVQGMWILYEIMTESGEGE